MSKMPVGEEQNITDIFTQGIPNSTGSVLPVFSSTYRFQASEKIFTDAYQNDPIAFNPDARFVPAQITSVLSNIPDVAQRDLASYVEVNITNNQAQYLPIGLYSTRYNADSFNRTLASRKQFIQFGV